APSVEAKPVFQPGRSFKLAFMSICIVTMAAALEATSLSIALPIITERLNGTAIQAFWSGTSFLVASAVFQPIIGGLSHGFVNKDQTKNTKIFAPIPPNNSDLLPTGLKLSNPLRIFRPRDRGFSQ